MKLVVGNKNYSSWSLRPWLMIDGFGLAFETVQESLKAEGRKERFGKYSGTSKVPVLIDNGLNIWDSMAICEYVSENYLDGKGWPENKTDRALARSICAEMHSGFGALRKEMPMNIKAQREVVPSEAAKNDIARVDAIWSEYASADKNADIRLFGSFSIADCFFAPVLMRFRTYGVELSPKAKAYYNSMLKHPSLVKWMEMAVRETEVIGEDEAGKDIVRK